MKIIREHLTSFRNRHFRFVMGLHKVSERRQSGLFIIEGLKEIRMAVEYGYRVQMVFFCPDLIGWQEVQGIIPSAEVYYSVSRDLYNRMVYREESGGVLLVVAMKDHSLRKLQVKPDALLVVLESVEKPGNLGAILRTADAAGVDAVIVGDPRTDLYNPNVIRASIGCLFSVPVYLGNSDEIIEMLKFKGIRIVCTSPAASEVYYYHDFTRATAIVLGTESTGLTDIWIQHATETISVPMKGKADSLNVSITAAILIFEAIRQRDLSALTFNR